LFYLILIISIITEFTIIGFAIILCLTEIIIRPI